jgi:ethanolamine utilization cobalamin adenosyltransferase
MTANGKKPEYMTSLSGTKLVSKTHERIAFRGLVDTLQAEVIEAQVLASGLGEAETNAKLGEILDYLRTLMAAEVKETPLPPPFLFGMDAEEMRRRSHEVFISGAEGKAVLPDYSQGPMAARLNYLRAKTREVELLSVKVFGQDREDIILALNRLSSALWWLTCQRQNTPWPGRSGCA